jgi:hypothetical protein
LSAGVVGFLVERANVLRGSSTYSVEGNPPTTNQSFEPRLHGWCGTYNDLATFGRGLVRVTKTTDNGRAYVQELQGDELLQALEALGYPELAGDVEGGA